MQPPIEFYYIVVICLVAVSYLAGFAVGYREGLRDKSEEKENPNWRDVK